MKINSLILTLLLLLLCNRIFAQTIVVTDDATYTSGHASSVLDVKSTTKGFLIPRLSQAERNAIVSPAGGLMIYQTDNSPGFYYYNGSSWMAITGTADGSETKVNSGASVNVTGQGTLASPYTPSFRTQSVTQSQRVAISSPLTGQIVWCTDCGSSGEMQIYNGTSWTTWCGGTPSPALPAVSTTSVSAIAATTASSGGNVTSDGGGTVTARGVCWNTSSGPTTANSKTTDGSGTGSFTSSVSGLSPSTLYYIRAYATNSAGTSYGSEFSFTTVPAITGTTAGSRCGTGTVSLSATASSGTINWYASSSGGSSLGTGTSFTTPSISSTTSYWVDATNSSGTSTPRTEVVATINAIPTITGTTPGSRCGTGTVALGASASAGTINWYSVVSGGSSLGTGTSFTTPSISATTTYYVDATSNGCTTGTRTSVVATVNSVPSAPTGATGASRCGTGTVTISVSSPGAGLTIDWYATSTGGSVLSGGSGTISYTTPSISSTTVYYAETRNTTTGCVSATRTSVTATINPIPTITGTTPASRCGTGTVTLGATASAGTINWYTVVSGGTSSGTGTSFTTPSISATTTYYVDATSGGCTTGSRTSVVATINSVPSAPTGATNGSRCGTGTVVISVSSPGAGLTIDWYAASSGGSVLTGGTGVTSFTTPSISSTTTYWAQTRNTTTGCVSATRTSVIATINTIPTITGTTPGSRSGTGTVVLGATASAGTINWYAAASGGSSLGTGTSWTTPSISVTTTYYVDATSNGCTTASRTSVVATVTAGLAIGDYHEGGIIVYLDGTGHGFVCTESDIGSGSTYLWQNTAQITGANWVNIGYGDDNTAAIYDSPALDAIYYDGYWDWYFPSRYELWEIYRQRAYVPGLSGIYWSSTEYTQYTAYRLNFDTGVGSTSASKTSQYNKVRAIKYF